MPEWVVVLGWHASVSTPPSDTAFRAIRSRRRKSKAAALPPSTCAGLIAAISVIEEEPHWVVRLRENADLMRKGLSQLGFTIGPSVSAVIPVIVGEDLAAYQLARALHAQGVYVSPVAYPAVRKNAARVRVSVMATHTIDDIMTALTAFEKARKMVPLLHETLSRRKTGEGEGTAHNLPSSQPSPASQREKEIAVPAVAA